MEQPAPENHHEPVVTPAYEQSNMPTPTEPNMLVRIEQIFGFFKSGTSLPTYTPRSFRESIVLDSTHHRIYFYDADAGAWDTITSA